ncbi:ParB/RepB/Spo0J family partition protein [Pseudoflavonifractor phocaeensis]|uniref:ParB/RepB/Spo0J family partition protein n=1 Tax=Pseudoflavonifractor phocaeensis TaxID=1870988 RepID=UPI0019597C0E|nr:ParB/RepB/Spo0J family partition protein [Pseudoflavonifractor phocaeensis]MBM6885564.1 ParB/RepB/Spo0J family partition protein [Pseudoflavonifractor phocaeensis]
MMNEQVRNIPIAQLHPFRHHPFQVKDDEAMAALCDSIREYGILSPLLARPAGEVYEMVSGHRRRLAAIKLGLQELPVLVRDMTDDEAIILMVDSNIQRENLLPSEKAFAYRMKIDALHHQGKTSRQLGEKWSVTQLSESGADSERQVHRYIRLTYLVKPILDLVDQSRIAFSPAVELSFLTGQEQAELWDIMQFEDRTPSLSQAVRLKKLSQKGELTQERIYEIMSEEKANQKERIRFEVSQLRNYFPKGYTARQMEQAILQLLEANYKK